MWRVDGRGPALLALSVPGSAQTPMKAQPQNQASEAQFVRHAERAVRQSLLLPSRRTHYEATREYLGDSLLPELQESTRRPDAPADAYLVLGECWLRLGNYGAAEGAFSKAAERFAGVRGRSRVRVAADAELRRTRDLVRTAAATKQFLPAGNSVVQVERLPAGAATPHWIILSARWLTPSKLPAGRPFDTFSDVHFTVLSERGDHFLKVWQSGPLTSPLPDDECNDMRFYVIHQARTDSPQVVITQTWIGGDNTQERVAVYGWNGTQLTKLFGGTGMDDRWIEDVNGDGRYEIGIFKRIGYSLPEYEKPRWFDIYAWNGRAYVNADAPFRKLYGAMKKEILALLRRHPGDNDLLLHLAMIYEFEQHPQRALRVYRRAARSCRAELAQATRAEGRRWLDKELRDIRSRIERPGKNERGTPGNRRGAR
jgi:tetratricopeptide (TPR) repeat protein